MIPILYNTLNESETEMKNELFAHETTSAARRPMPVIYVRSATDDEGQLTERLNGARELAQINGLVVAAAEIVVEHGSGADIVGRPGLQRLLQMADRGEISHLVILRTSHLSRDYHALREMLVALTQAGVTVVTSHGANEPIGAHDTYMAPLAKWR